MNAASDAYAIGYEIGFEILKYSDGILQQMEATGNILEKSVRMCGFNQLIVLIDIAEGESTVCRGRLSGDENTSNGWIFTSLYAHS